MSKSTIIEKGRTESDPRVVDEWTRSGDRASLGGYDLNLAVDGEKDPALMYRWVTNEGGRIQNMLNRGYRPVLQDMKVNVKGDAMTDDGNWISKKTGRLDTGAPQESYLMATKREFYNESMLDHPTTRYTTSLTWKSRAALLTPFVSNPHGKSATHVAAKTSQHYQRCNQYRHHI